jgi:PKD repeat protein
VVQPSIGWSYVNGTNANSENPEIQFNTYGLYTVTLTVSNLNGESIDNPSVEIMVNSGVGLDAYAHVDLNMYPNPTSGDLNLEFVGNLEGAKLSVLSTIGAEVMSFDVLPNSIDASKLSNGTYFVVLALPNGARITRLFVKK